MYWRREAEVFMFYQLNLIEVTRVVHSYTESAFCSPFRSVIMSMSWRGYIRIFGRH